MSNESWRIKGEYFESCNCELLCPCLLSHAQARPTEGHCDVVLAIHIASGTCGEVDLSGLNAVQADAIIFNTATVTSPTGPLNLQYHIPNLKNALNYCQ